MSRIDEDTLVAYALGVLEAERVPEVEAYLARHPQAAAQVRAHLETLTAVVMALPPESVPAEAETALLARLRSRPASARTRPSPRRRRQIPPRVGAFWATLATVVILALVWIGGGGRYYENYLLERRVRQDCAVTETLCVALVSDTNQPLGTLVQRADNVVYVLFDGAPPADRIYQSWEIVGDTVTPVSISSGRVISTERPLVPTATFGVSLEPPGGSPQPTTTPIVVQSL